MLLLADRCDADPETLAKYVIALVKKDRPDDDLREMCLKELHIFLKDGLAAQLHYDHFRKTSVVIALL